MRRLWLMNFDEQVGGLKPGIAGALQGHPGRASAGCESQVRLLQASLSHPSPRSRWNRSASIQAADTKDEDFRKLVEYLVQKGLRAQLVTANFLTGQQAITLDFFPTAAPARVQVGWALHGVPDHPGSHVGTGSTIIDF